MPSTHRRGVLRALGGGAAAVGAALAGCSSSCPDTDQPTPAETLRAGADPAGPFASTPGGAWPSLRAGPGNTGFADVTPVGPGSVLRWRTSVDLPGDDASVSSPVVGDGRVLLAGTERVHALSVRTGEALWTSDPVAPTRPTETGYGYDAGVAAPTVRGGTVYAGTGTGAVALDAADGTVEWAAGTPAGATTPAYRDGTVYAAGRDALVALDAADGTELWRHAVDRRTTVDPPAVGDGVVVLPTPEGALALDATTGERRWRAGARADTHAVLSDGLCIYGNDEGLHAVAADTGAERWSFARGDYRALTTPVVAPGTVYAVEQPGEAGAATFALDYDGAERPEPRWCSTVGDGAAVAATPDRAFCLSPFGEGPDAGQGLAAYTADLGDVPWALAAGDGPARAWLTPPAVLDGALVATTRSGTVLAVGGGA